MKYLKSIKENTEADGSLSNDIDSIFNDIHLLEDFSDMIKSEYPKSKIEIHTMVGANNLNFTDLESFEKELNKINDKQSTEFKKQRIPSTQYSI